MGALSPCLLAHSSPEHVKLKGSQVPQANDAQTEA